MNRNAEAWARLGRAMREERERQGRSQQDVADAASTSIGTLRSIETGTVPKARMPQSIAKVAAALGWPAGTVDHVLGGGDPPGGWIQSRSVQVPAGVLSGAMTHGMVTATDNVTASEIRAAVSIALDELRRQGFVSDPGEAQPAGTKVSD